jgi:regulator of sigma E protease
MANPEFVEGKDGEKATESLPEAKPLDKIIVAAAGPAASILCGLAFACIVWVVGKPVHQSELTTVIGEVHRGGPGERGGLLAGDKIVSINGAEITRFAGMGGMKNSVLWNVAKADSPELTVVVERGDDVLTKKVVAEIPEREGWGRRLLPQIGISPAITPKILEVRKGGPADRAGIAKGDVFIQVNGEPALSYGTIADIIERGGEMEVVLDRNGEQIVKQIETAREKDGSHYIGVEWDVDSMTSIEHPTPFRQVGGAVTVMAETLVALFTPGSEVKAQHLSGPVGIMRLYYLLFEMPDGWRIALWFSVIFNVNLAILNLLPLPVLDGGHISLSILEWLRGRRLGIKTVEVMQTACAVLILGFMLYVTSYDVLDYLSELIHGSG